MQLALSTESRALPAAFVISKNTRAKIHNSRLGERTPRHPALFFQGSQEEQPQSMESNSSLQAINAIRNNEQEDETSPIQRLMSSFVQNEASTFKGGPPWQIEDSSLLLYDIFLILNLSVSISFWVVHRMSFLNIVPAFSEGSLICILWIVAGLWNGAFLYSAVDGHYDMTKEENEGKGGPKSAALLGLSTFVTTASLRIIVALGMGVLEHRQVGLANGEELIPLEIAFGLMLMSAWRMLHSSYARV